MGSAKKTFERGQPVEVQRDVGKPWEPATYVEAMPDWARWHAVELPEGQEHYVDARLGVRCAKDDPGAIASRRLTVPSRRVRAIADRPKSCAGCG